MKSRHESRFLPVERQPRTRCFGIALMYKVVLIEQNRKEVEISQLVSYRRLRRESRRAQ